MFAVQYWNGPGRGHYSRRTQINAGAKMGPLFESASEPLLTSDMRPLDRYDTHQKTISRRPEQMYSSSDTGLGRGSLFTSVSNKRCGAKLRLSFKIISWAITEIRHGALGQI